jgi:D-tyrosyl-tRNA(Tyr) deacylase
MRAVVQRVRSARVEVDAQTVGSVERGLAVLLGVHKDDTIAEADWMAERLIGLRIFEDDQSKMNLSVAQIGGGLLIIPNFTLCAQTGKGHRPSFIDAMEPARAIGLFERVVATARASGLPVGTGSFGADMLVTIQNDGPVTLILERAAATPQVPS